MDRAGFEPIWVQTNRLNKSRIGSGGVQCDAFITSREHKAAALPSPLVFWRGMLTLNRRLIFTREKAHVWSDKNCSPNKLAIGKNLIKHNGATIRGKPLEKANFPVRHVKKEFDLAQRPIDR